MKKGKNTYSHCEPIQEIMGSVPPWITRWGITIIFSVFVIILLGCFLIHYPQTVSAPVTLMTTENGATSGRMSVPSSGFGKVQVGQVVYVRIDCFPYLEFGMFTGTVSDIEDIPQKTPNGQFLYTVQLAFPKRLVSNYGYEPRPLREMPGSATIIIQEQRLIEKIIPQIRVNKTGNNNSGRDGVTQKFNKAGYELKIRSL